MEGNRFLVIILVNCSICNHFENGIFNYDDDVAHFMCNVVIYIFANYEEKP